MNFIKRIASGLGAVFLATLLIAALEFASPALRADEMTYTVNQALPGGSIVGHITTDGTQGNLGSIENDSWSFGANDGTTTGTSSGGGGVGKVDLSGLDLSATPTSLRFNFSGVDGGELIFPLSNGGFIIWATADCQVCASIAGVSGGFVAAVDIGGDGVTDVLSLSGVQTIGMVAAAPEPATSNLMLIGLGLLGVSVLARQRNWS